MSRISFVRRVAGSFSVSRIVTLLVIGIGALGIAYYNQRFTASTGNFTTLNATRVSITAPSLTSAVFTIPELGVQLTLPNGLTPSDLQYYAQINRPVTAADPHSWSTVSFTTNSLLQQDSECTASEGSIGMIVRYTEDPMAIHAKVRESLPLGNYYFAFAAPQGNCTMNPAAQALERTQIQLLQQAFESVKASN